MSWSKVFRQLSAIVTAITIAGDYYRDPSSSFSSLATWGLASQFIYFQLPGKSRAFAYFHSTAFLYSIIIPISYIYFIVFYDSSLEINHMNDWDYEWTTILLRSFMMHFLPMILHIVDMVSNRNSIISAYRSRPKRIMVLWPALSILAVSLCYELLSIENTDDEVELSLTVSQAKLEDFYRTNKILSIGTICCGYMLLYLFVFRNAYQINSIQTLLSFFRKSTSKHSLHESPHTNSKSSHDRTLQDKKHT